MIRTLTAKPALTPGEGRGEAGERVAADAEERRGAQGDQDQVAGVGGDAGEPADQDDDEREQARPGRPRRACGSARPSARRSSATPTPIMATKMTATTLKLAKLVTNEEKMKRMPVDREQADDLGRLGVDLRLLVGVGGRRHLGLRLHRAADVRLLDGNRRHLGDLVGHLDVERAQQRREQDDEDAEPGEDHRRVRHLVAERLDPSRASAR